MSCNIRSIELKDGLIMEAVFFSGDVRAFNVRALFEKHPGYRILETDKALWNSARLFPHGSGVYFNDEIDLTAEEIWRDGEDCGKVPVEARYRLAYSLACAREGLDISQQQLSDLSGVPVRDISRIEGGVDSPLPDVLSKLCEILDVNADLDQPLG